MVGTAWAGSITFADLNLENGAQYTDPFDGGDFTVTFAGGTNDGKYYTTGSGIRVYGGGTMTIAAKGDDNIITKIAVTYDGSNKPTTNDIVNVGTYNSSTGIWTGSAASVVFTRPSGSGHWRVQKIEVTVESSGSGQLTGEIYELLNGTPATIVEGDYIITGNYSDSKYAMSNDVSNNSFNGKTDFQMDGNANIVTDDNTIVWHIAPQGDYWTIQSLDGDKLYAAYTGSSDGVTMASTLDDNALWSYNGNNGFTNKANNATLYFNSGKFSFAPNGTPVFTLYRMPDKYYVAGSWTNWATSKIEMTKNADGTFTLANQDLAAEAKFKIIKVVSAAGNPIWYGGEGNDPNNDYWLTADNHTDISLFTNGDAPNFYMPIAGTWTFIVNPTDATLTVDGDWPEWEYYLRGTFNEPEWAIVDSYKFSQVGETSKFTLNKPIKYGEKFKIYGKRGNEEKWFGAAESEGAYYVNAENVGTELSLTTENGGEDFYMNLSNKKSYWELEFDPENKTLVLGNYLSDIAELRFEFDGGRNAIESTAGLTTNGLSSDYSNSPKLKFDTSSQYLILHFDERPGILTFDIKRNQTLGTAISVFEVQTSENGEDWNTLETYDNLSTSVQSEKFDNLDENVRYIKWVLKEKNNGNVALGNIVLEKYVAPQSYTLNIDAVENGEVFVFYNDPDNYYPAIEDGDEVLEGSEVLVSVSAEEGYEIKDIAVTDADGQRLQLTAEEDGISWTFTMPKSNVTVSCTIEEINYDTEEWVLTDIADLTENDIFVIVGYDNQYRAMANVEDSEDVLPAIKGINISGDDTYKIITSTVTDNMKWNISGNATDGYTFYPYGKNKEEWLYITNSNKGVHVGGTNNNNKLTIKDGYLYNENTERYIGIYSQAHWRCYKLGTNGDFPSNIAGQTFAFYRLIQPEKFEFSISDKASDGTDCYATISALGEGNWKVKGDVTVSTVVVENKVLTYPIQFVEGDVIPGDGAYLVKGAAGDYAFEKTKNPKEVDLGNNMLLSTGEGDIQTNAPTGETDNNKYYFYKLSLNKKSTPGSVGFYWGNSTGSAFNYTKGHQAYLAVPKTDAFTVQGFSFDGTTGIAEVESAVNGNDEVYTISGMRVDGSNLSKGVYIVNGKKVIIK